MTHRLYVAALGIGKWGAPATRIPRARAAGRRAPMREACGIGSACAEKHKCSFPKTYAKKQIFVIARRAFIALRCWMPKTEVFGMPGGRQRAAISPARRAANPRGQFMLL